MSAVGRREVLLGLGAGAVWVATGCSTPDRGSSPRTTSTAPITPAVLPDAATTMGWVEEVVAGGVRRPGYAADEAATDLAADMLRSLGLDVHTEPVEVTRWEPTDWRLEVVPAAGAPFTVDCWPLPHAAPADGIELELVAHHPGAPAATTGRAALADAPLVELPAAAIAEMGSAPEDPVGRVFDPDGTLADEVHLLPHTAARNRVADEVFAAGAAAFVGRLVNHPLDGHRYYVPYHGEPLPGPGVWISGDDGARLHDLLAAGPVRIRLTVASTSTVVTSRTVVGELAGADDEIVMIGSHHDGPWASAVEDATGIALVLAQASYWAAVPRAERPHRLRFVLHAGHMSGSAGQEAFIAEHADDWDRTVLAVHLEHAALETDASGAGDPERCTPRWFFTSRLAPLEATVARTVAEADLRRSLVVAPDALGQNPPTDAGRLHSLGVPIVQLLGAPWYLFDEADTLDKVDRDHLPAIGGAVAAIVASTSGVSAAAMRAG